MPKRSQARKATKSKAKASRIILGGVELGNITAQEVEQSAGIVVLRDLFVQFGYVAMIRAENCRIDDPSYECVAAFITGPGQGESKFLSILASEVFGGGCVGDHVKTKDETPLGAGPGQYKIRLQSIAVNFSLFNGNFRVIYYPTVKMWADGRLVVDVAFPTSQGAPQGVPVSQTWQIIYQP